MILSSSEENNSKPVLYDAFVSQISINFSASNPKSFTRKDFDFFLKITFDFILRNIIQSIQVYDKQ